MLILNVIDNGLACDCGVCRVLYYGIPPILQEIFPLKMGCTTKCIIFSIFNSWKCIIFYALRRR